MDHQDRALAIEDRLRPLFAAALAGDACAYRVVLGELGALLRGYYRRRLAGLPDEVEDLVQECLLAIHCKRHTWRADQPLTAWVHTIARYKLIDLLRARSRREALHDPLDDELEVFAQADTEAAHARRDLGQLLATVPERQRQALLMVKVEGASVADTARATGMSEASVKVGVHRTIKALAARVRGEA
jgi:RNA polymerase sigma factor (sigma-70 family)